MSDREKDLGALWVKQGAKGEFMSGNIEIDGVKKNITCFVNNYKKTDKHPDWVILESKPREAQAPNNQEELNKVDTTAKVEYPEDEINPEEIPY